MRYLYSFIATAALIAFSYSCKPKVDLNPEVVYTLEATTGEGAIWHPERQSLFFVDIEGMTLYELTPGEGANAWQFDRYVTTVVPESENTMIIAMQDNISRLNLSEKTSDMIAVMPVHGEAFRTNDGKCDPEGRLWVGTMGFRGPRDEGSAGLFIVSDDGMVTRKIDSVGISNGIVWTADKKYMYYNDTPTRKVARYKYDVATGDIEYDGVAVEIPKGTGAPDGMAIDENGNIWVAQWGGFGVYCYNPNTGELITKVEIPAPNVASCTFGGRNMDELYITTARAGLNDEQLAQYPLSGSVFRVRPGVKGAPVNYYKK